MNLVNTITMTSLELVSFINSSRAEGEAVLRHSDFLEKVPTVLGLETSGKFRSSYVGGNGQERPCYNFPKREACLMAMSYSYDLQAKVFDRMTELETKAVPPAPVNIPLLEKLNIIEKAKITLGNDEIKQLFPLIWQTISDGVQNDIVAMFGDSNKLITSTTPTLLDIMEIAKRNNITIPQNLKGVIGKYVKANTSTPPVQTERVINGGVRKSFAYTNHDEVLTLIKIKLDTISML